MSKYKEFKELILADPGYGIPGEIDALFGLRVWMKIVLPNVIKTNDNLAAAQNTSLWVIYQVSKDKTTKESPFVASVLSQPPPPTIMELNQTLRNFWEIDELPIKR